MDMRQALMLFTLAHALGYYYLSSFKADRKAVRLVPELLLYILAVTLVFSPVLDGNNWLYALTIVVFHIVVTPVVYLVSRRGGRARYISFIIVEAVRMTGFTVMAFVYSVRWGAFEPWRDVRFLLMEYALDFDQVLSYAFAFVVLLRPVNIVVRSLLSLVDGGDEEEQEDGGRCRLSVGPLVGIVERMFGRPRLVDRLRHRLLRQVRPLLPGDQGRCGLRTAAVHRLDPQRIRSDPRGVHSTPVLLRRRLPRACHLAHRGVMTCPCGHHLVVRVNVLVKTAPSSSLIVTVTGISCP